MKEVSSADFCQEYQRHASPAPHRFCCSGSFSLNCPKIKKIISDKMLRVVLVKLSHEKKNNIGQNAQAVIYTIIISKSNNFISKSNN
jgi:hypothetical protein